MKQGWIQSNTNGVYEDVAPKTLADLVYVDDTQIRTVKQALDDLGSNVFSDVRENVFYGKQAGENAKNSNHGACVANTYVGSHAGHNDAVGGGNTYVGNRAGENMTHGSGCIAIGFCAGSRTVSGEPQALCASSVFIGGSTRSGAQQANPAYNEIVIGNEVTGNGSNTITLGNNQITQLRCQATTITALSDSRVKEEIQPANVDMCLEAVKGLPVTRYKYKDFTGTHVDTHVTGFLANDVEKVFPKSVTKSDRYFPVLDENGEQVYEEVEETVVEADEHGQPVSKVVTRKVPQMFLMTDVKDLTMTEAVPTLWGAMQALIARLEALEGK